MSTTQGALAQSPKPEAHDKVLDNNPDGNFGFWGEDKTGVEKNLPEDHHENQQQTQAT